MYLISYLTSHLTSHISHFTPHRFLREDGKELVVVVQFADGTSGHTNILHGGIAALLFDEAMGWMAGAARLREAGNLDIIRDPTANSQALKVSLLHTFIHQSEREVI